MEYLLNKYAKRLKKVEKLSPLQQNDAPRKIKINPKMIDDNKISAKKFVPRNVNYRAVFDMIPIDNAKGKDCKYDKVVALSD